VNGITRVARREWPSLTFGALAVAAGIVNLSGEAPEESIFIAGFGLFLLFGAIPTEERWNAARLDDVVQGGSVHRALVYRGEPRNPWADVALWASVAGAGAGLAIVGVESERFSETFSRVLGWVCLAGGIGGFASRVRSLRHGVGVTVSGYGITCQSRRRRETAPWTAIAKSEFTIAEPRYYGMKLGSFPWFGLDVSDPDEIERSAWDRVTATFQFRSAWRGVDLMVPLPLNDEPLRLQIRSIVEHLRADPRLARHIESATSADAAVDAIESASVPRAVTKAEKPSVAASWTCSICGQDLAPGEHVCPACGRIAF
jgi:hypothetical protein